MPMLMSSVLLAHMAVRMRLPLALRLERRFNRPLARPVAELGMSDTDRLVPVFRPLNDAVILGERIRVGCSFLKELWLRTRGRVQIVVRATHGIEANAVLIEDTFSAGAIAASLVLAKRIRQANRGPVGASAGNRDRIARNVADVHTSKILVVDIVG